MLIEISETLKSYLLRTIPTDGTGDWIQIGELQGDNDPPPDNKLLVFLYGVGEHPHLRSQPLVRGQDDRFHPPPLTITLNYLITFISNDHKEVQKRLAGVLRAFHSRPRFSTDDLDPALIDRVGYLTARLRNPGSEELNQIWTSLNRSMRLALYYEVNAAVIEPAAEPGVPRVEERAVRPPS